MGSFHNIVELMKAAGEPTRFRLLYMLEHGEFSVKELTELLNQSQPRVSRHIKLLAEAGLIERYQEGSFVFVRSTSNPAVRAFIKGILSMIDGDDWHVTRDKDRIQQLNLRRSQSAHAYFDMNAANWDKIRSLHVPERDVEQAMIKALGAKADFDLMVDLGTGTGRILELFARHAKRLIGIDSNREMLKYARAKLEAKQLSHCSVRLSDIYDLPLAAHSADAVIVHQVLHFLDKPQHAIAEAARLLKPNGKLLIVDFARHTLEFLKDEQAHARLGFSQAEVESWFLDANMQPRLYHALKNTSTSEQLTVALWLATKNTKIEASPVPSSKVA